MKLKLFIFAIVLALIAVYVLSQDSPEIETLTYTTEDESFTFEYPEGWTVEVVNADQPSPHLSVDNLPLDERFDSPDGVNLQISLPYKRYNTLLSSAETPREAVEQSIHSVSQVAVNFSTPSPDKTPQQLDIEPVAPDVIEFTVNDRPAAYGYSHIEAMGVEVSQLAIVIDLGDDYWVDISVSSYEGGLETLQKNEETILNIVRSMRYTAPEPVYSGNLDLPQVYSGVVGIWGRGDIEFYYPEGWYATYAIATVAISNKAGTLINTEPEPGQFIAFVNGVDETRSMVSFVELFDHCNAQNDDITARELVEQVLGRLTSANLEQLEDAGITMTQPEVVTANSKEIVYMRQYQDDIEALTLFIDLDNGNILSMQITAHKGDIAPFEDQLFAVAGTFEYTPKPCEE